MVFGVEKKKLEKLQSSLTSLTDFNEESNADLQLIFTYYVKTIKRLHSKEANIFGNIHRYGIAEMKKLKEKLKKEPGQENFDLFKNYMLDSMENALEYMKEYLHV